MPTSPSLFCDSIFRVSLDLLSVQANTGPIWDNKTEQGFWRGRDSRQERLDLVKLSRKNPDLINASLTNFFFFKQDDEMYGPKVKHVSFFEFFKVGLYHGGHTRCPEKRFVGKVCNSLFKKLQVSANKTTRCTDQKLNTSRSLNSLR